MQGTVFTTTPNVETLWSTVAAFLPSFDSLVAPASNSLSLQLTKSLTNALIGAILTDDLSSVNRLLFPGRTIPLLPNFTSSFPTTLLVNCLGHKGWSPIHRCVGATHSSIAILDALYMAGADVSLFTTHPRCPSIVFSRIRQVHVIPTASVESSPCVEGYASRLLCEDVYGATRYSTSQMASLPTSDRGRRLYR
jgi:hypothetical protein